MSERNKSKRILLSILLCGCMSNYAHAATYPFETSFTNEGTATYSEGGEVAEGTWSYEIQGEEVDFEVTYTYDNTAEPTYDEETETYIGTFTDTTGGIINDGGEYDNFIDGSSITGTFIGFTMVDHGNGVATNPYYVSGAIYNYGEGQVINNITAGFLLDGEDLTQEEEEQHSDGKELGGAIYNGGGATINSITNSFFLGDDVESLGKKDRAGGAIYNTGSYIGTIENCYFIGDMAITTGDTTSNGKAGAIYNGIISTIGTITGSYFIGNEATMYGGAIENEYSTIGSITGSFFIENKVTGAINNNDTFATTGKGGAIYNYYDNKDTDAYIGEIKNCYFIENYANYEGGAIYNEGGTIENISGSYFIENVSGGYGGAIYNDVQNSKVEGDNYINISDSYFTDNRAEGGRGGAIYNSSDGIIKSIEGTSFTGNSATTEEGYAVGGAIFNTGTITTAEFTELTGNYAVSEDGRAGGGAIFNMGHITITGGDVADNYAVGTDYVGGGAILNINLNDPTEVDITISSLTGNSAVSTGTGSDLMAVGGGIADLEGIVTINGSVENNYAQGANAGGGAIAGYGTAIEITGDITGNYAIATNGAAAGGAVAGIGTTVTITGNVTGNYATATGGGDYSGAAGGAFYNSGTEDTKGTLTITEGEISGNWASAAGEGNAAYGGAIYNAENGILSITDDVTFSGNYAVSEEGAAAGGAIYNAGTTGDDGLTLGSLTGNYAQGATDAKGGAIYDETSTEVTINGDVSGNYVKVTGEGDVAGGVIYLAKAEEGETSITVNGDVTGNHAETASGEAKGGAFYNNADGTLTITGDISGNWASAAGEGNAAYGGAIYNEGSLTITAEGVTISGNYVTSEAVEAGGGAILNAGTLEIEGGAAFSGNYAVSTGGDVAGGAICNVDSGTITIGEDVTFSGNYVVSEEGRAGGGAIYNAGTINDGDGLTLGSLTGNYAEGATGAYGGAVYSTVDTNVTINGDVSDNYARVTKEGDVTGGVIYLYLDEGTETTVTVNGNVTGNHAETANGYAYGGAFYNNENGTLTITGDISGNYVIASDEAAGGAVYNEGTLNITATSLSGNYAESSSADAAGGAIYTTSADSITVNGDVTGNYAAGAGGDAGGGAIYTENEDITITITGDVTDNYVTAGSGTALGGAIYSQGTTVVTGAITGNYAEGSDAAGGGAIYNEGALTVNATSIENNYAKSSGGTAYGGAIYVDDDEEGSTITVTGNITGNYAVASSGDAKGGAIYTSGDVNVIADGTDISISGNYTDGSDGKDDNAIYLSTADGTVTFDISNNGSVTMEDNIRGEDGYSVSITGDSADSSTFYLLNDVYNANLTAGNTTINTVNNEIHQYAVKSFTLTGDVNMAVDADLANEAVDSFTAESYGSHEGTLTITGLNIMSDAKSDTLEISFAEDGLRDYVTLSSGATSAYTKIYKYDIAYDDRSDAGYLVFNQTGNNPAVLDAEEAEAGAMAFMNMMFKYAFEHSDYYMKLPSKVRLAIREKARSAKEGETVDAAADAAAMEAEGAYRMYNGHSLTEPGVWVKPFSSNETIPFKNQFTARTKNYGILVGADTEFKEKGKWASVFTGYAGYDGIQQTFSGNNVKQNGGLVGVTETLYKNNFYVALTATAGENEVKARNMYGTDKTHLYMYGVGAKAGYSLEFADGKYSVLPTFMVSYTYADMKNYTNGAGVRIDSSGMHAIELNPNVKLVRNFDNGWQPYVTVGEVWNVGQGSGTRADGIELDKFSYRPYTEYGLGVQKNWGGSYDGYAEFLGHAGGRRGFLATLGFRWAF